MDKAQARLDKISQELCWYPLGMCSSKAETTVKEPIGSAPMQYCTKHDTEMRMRYHAQALKGGSV